MKKISSNKKILILGSNGFLGRSLFDAMNLVGARVSGTIRKKNANFKKRLVLDLESERAVNNFQWKDFDTIIDCTGNVDYRNTLESEIQNIKSNTLIPLGIVSHLSEKQKYFYCSTHAVLLSDKAQNPYSLSKLLFENFIKMSDEDLSRVTILRLPGLFYENRSAGLLNLIRESFRMKKPITLELSLQKWHAMYLHRARDVIMAAIFQQSPPPIATIGYPLETDVKKIINVAESSFGYEIPIVFKKIKTDKYVPNINTQKSFYNMGRSDFEKDLKTYFKT